jgi:tetratricopeptide (TPR) repeat protein
MKVRPFGLMIVLALFASPGFYAQKSLVYQLPSQDYKTGIELFEKQKYAAAQEFFKKVLENPANQNTYMRANAEYYAGLCALELYNPDADYLLTRFITTNPENYKANEAWFYMGRSQYNNKKYDQALNCFGKVKPEGLNDDQLHEYHFEAGYSEFMGQNLDKAKLHFYEIKDIDTKYTAPAVYFYSHIAYQQKNYETALEGFQRLNEDETFAPIIPYYITQIYFMQKKYDKVVEYAPALLDSVVEKRVGEMSRIIAESYFQLGKYYESLPYFEKYAEKASSMTPEDRYMIAYAYYKADDIENAIKYFEPIASAQTALGQNASYHLADCYLRTKNKTKARLAFASASSMDFNPDIKENALFNYAVATYELSLSAFNEAVKAFEEFIRLYPNSNRADDAYNYLVMAYLSTKNYQAAVESIDKIRNKDNTVLKAQQRVAFFRGLELYNSLRFQEAADMFDKSLSCARFDALLAARAWYWKGESLYRLADYGGATNGYNSFLSTPGASNLSEFETAHYNIGYCKFDQKKYDEAMDWFRRYTGLMKDAKTQTVADAYNRIADCYFMKATYWVAIENYEKAMALNVANPDYSLFQKAFSLGLVNRQEKKISFLDQLLSTYPGSPYVDDALYEKGRAYVVLGNNAQAETSFKKLLADYQNSSYTSKALLQLGQIYFNTDKNQQAIDCYKKVAEMQPGSLDARNALNGLKLVYVDMNDVDSYFAYLEKSGEKSSLRNTEQDSLLYVAAENVYMTGDCDKSSLQFHRYLERFPSGNFVMNSKFYLADCAMRNNRPDSAIAGFEYVLAQPRSMFTEQALANAASIQSKKENYKAALEFYQRLETEAELAGNIQDGKVGQMRCSYHLADYPATIAAAKKVLTAGIVADEISREAHFLMAKTYLENKDMPNATLELKNVAKDVKSAEGAEAKYLLCQLYYNQNKKDAAEKEIFDFIDKNTPYQYWLGKSFILLSDIYVDKKDDFQAMQTLQSILDYYAVANDGIKDEAHARKEKIEARQSLSQAPAQQQDIELNMDKSKKK